MPSSRSGAGGKIVANRRRQRIAATPYDRPPPPPPARPKSPNWFSGIIVPSARAIVSGAGRVFTSIFSESESSSSEDEDAASEDGVDSDNQHENLYDGVSNKVNMTSSERMQYGGESQLMNRHAETKRLIEQLIMQESFSREECDKLIQVLNSRVIGCSTEEWEKSSLADPPGKMTDHEDADVLNKAVQEAKKWFQEKKVGSSSVTEFAHETPKLKSNVLEQVDSGGGSPVDVARSYMKERPLWASPTRNLDLRTPLISTMKLFNERTLYSAGPDSLSSSKKRNSLASGSWNIQEELRRVRSKATDDMLRTPSSKVDPSLFAVPQSKAESVGVVFALGEQMTKPESLAKARAINELVDTGVSYDPALSALGSRQDGKASEALSSRPATSVYGNNEELEAVRADGECGASKSPDPSSPNHTEVHQNACNWLSDTRRWENINAEMESRLRQERELKRLESSVNYDSHLTKTNGPTAEVNESGMEKTVNGISSPQASVPAGANITELHMEQNYEQHNVENHEADTINEKISVDTSQGEEGNCELLSEAYTEVPIVTEMDSITSGSHNSFSIQHDKSPPRPSQPSPKEKVDGAAAKQQGRKSGRYNQRKLKKR